MDAILFAGQQESRALPLIQVDWQHASVLLLVDLQLATGRFCLTEDHKLRGASASAPPTDLCPGPQSLHSVAA